GGVEVAVQGVGDAEAQAVGGVDRVVGDEVLEGGEGRLDVGGQLGALGALEEQGGVRGAQGGVAWGAGEPLGEAGDRGVEVEDRAAPPGEGGGGVPAADRVGAAGGGAVGEGEGLGVV